MELIYGLGAYYVVVVLTAIYAVHAYNVHTFNDVHMVGYCAAVCIVSFFIGVMPLTFFGGIWSIIFVVKWWVDLDNTNEGIYKNET